MEVTACRGHYLMSLLVLQCEQSLALLGRQAQLEEPAQSTHFNLCILVLAMGLLAYKSLHSGSQSSFPGVSAVHVFCKRRRRGFFANFFSTCVCDFLVS